MRARVDLPTRIGPSIAMVRGGSNAGAGYGWAEVVRDMAGNYSRKTISYVKRKQRSLFRRVLPACSVAPGWPG